MTKSMAQLLFLLASIAGSAAAETLLSAFTRAIATRSQKAALAGSGFLLRAVNEPASAASRTLLA
eukprot:CAMPEP_0117567568 /NCGR_PEP_ID=MMETSP0784-20121206/57670_1 /TAXON_ID=39447 /ORGANISM="" /LENGTH=64 /DNA_ID=CAMNT_0005365435 /DNA_START=36 /DNA_END=227 /DNA_ORIENTATION=+